jgi:regulator of nucleoside diphosphate kinase
MTRTCPTIDPAVVLTEVDLGRLSELLESPRYRATDPASLAGLKREIERGEVVAPCRIPRGVVTMRSRVRVRDIPGGHGRTFTLVYPEEADIERGRVSVLAPLGVALLGARAGQTVSVHAPSGLRRFKVERVLYQPEAAGDLHL